MLSQASKVWHKDPIITIKTILLKTTTNPTASVSYVSKPWGEDVYLPPAVPRRVTCTCNVIYLASLGSESPLNSLRPGSVCSTTHHQRVKSWPEWILSPSLILLWFYDFILFYKHHLQDIGKQMSDIVGLSCQSCWICSRHFLVALISIHTRLNLL